MLKPNIFQTLDNIILSLTNFFVLNLNKKKSTQITSNDIENLICSKNKTIQQYIFFRHTTNDKNEEKKER